MLFEKEKYYSYIGKIESSITWCYVITMIFAVLIGIAMGGVGLIITIPLGILLSGIWTLSAKIRVQEMKYKIDMYEFAKNK